MKTYYLSNQSLRLLYSGRRLRWSLLLAFLVYLANCAWANPLNFPFQGTLIAAERHENYPPAPTWDQLQGAPVLFFLTATGRADPPEVGYPQLGSLTAVYTGMFDYASGAGQLCTRFIDVNGDSLFTTSTAQATPTNDPRTMSVTEFHTVVRGTGYFRGAGGSFTLTRSVTRTPDGLMAHSQGSFNGWLSWLSVARN
jgi:hypothetical protein